jgi:hypothetical protein
MKKFLLFLILLFIPMTAYAQCNGTFPANTLCGSVGGGFPGPIQFSTAAVVAPQGRLTLASQTPVMGPTSCASAPCTNKTTIYYDCYVGCVVPVLNGGGITPQVIASGEVSDALPASSTGVVNANDIFDMWWVATSAVTGTICHVTNGSGAGWSADTGGSITARGTGYTQLGRVTGYPVNANTLTHCYHGSTDLGPVLAGFGTYLGTFATTGSAGTVSFTFGGSASGGSAGFLGLWNYYNRISVNTSVIDTSSPYTYTTHAYRQSNGSAGNQIVFVLGVAEDNVYASYNTSGYTSGATGAFLATSIGFDNSTVPNCIPGTAFAGSSLTAATTPATVCAWVVSAGKHTEFAIEESDGSNANIFNSSSLNTLNAMLRM